MTLLLIVCVCVIVAVVCKVKLKSLDTTDEKNDVKLYVLDMATNIFIIIGMIFMYLYLKSVLH